MSENDFGQLAYLSLLLLVIGGYFLIQNRHRLGAMLQQASIWALIFVGVIAAAGLWENMRDDVLPRQTVIADQGVVELPRAPDGHFYMLADVNDTAVRFVVDTGATTIVLSMEDAARVGIDTDRLVFLGRANTANGEVRTAMVKLDELRIGELSDRNVRAWVNEGELNGSLLGMSYLDRFERVEITRDTMRLIR
ncbi:aspartyl protease [Actibacterium mucosum KCTC 23349]|uniref:Aspartyl protease n=1 Tax=Actibacterium mucosum KCTC 23349 TaxID=1454373 RepID=A0A037ZL99_9RHOB|nr:TIGR02281 family clan AA aspartic protease [Actibacterium mucosum]KAJ55616.1 aspartyl protease [Actibacterium mucosum KCTC 23349]